MDMTRRNVHGSYSVSAFRSSSSLLSSSTPSRTLRAVRTSRSPSPDNVDATITRITSTTTITPIHNPSLTGLSHSFAADEHEHEELPPVAWVHYEEPTLPNQDEEGTVVEALRVVEATPSVSRIDRNTHRLDGQERERRPQIQDVSSSNSNNSNHDYRAHYTFGPSSALHATESIARKPGKIMYRFARKHHICERCCVGFFAIAAMWLTSLSICALIVHSFLRPMPLQEATLAADEAWSVIKDQKSAFEGCVRTYIKGCDINLRNKLRREEDNVRNRAELNSERVILGNRLNRQCASQYEHALAAIRYLQQNGFWLPEFHQFNDEEADAEKQQCARLIREIRTNQASVQAVNVAEVFSTEAQTRGDLALSSISNRRAYDQAYASRKLSELLDGVTLPAPFNPTPILVWVGAEIQRAALCLLGSSENPGTSPEPSGVMNGASCPRFRERFADWEAVIRANLAKWRAEMEQYQKKVNDLVKLVKGFLKALSIEGVRVAIDAAVLFFPGLGHTWMLNRIGWSPDLFSLNLDMNIPAPPPTMFDPAIHRMERAALRFGNATGRVLTSIAQATARTAQAAQHALAARAGFLVNVTQEVAGLITPPSIPRINITDLRAHLLNASSPQAILNEAIQLANASARSWAFASQNRIMNATAVAESRASQFLGGIQRRALGVYVTNAIDPRKLLETWGALLGLAFLIDYAFRGLRTLHMLRRFWSHSAVNVPRADVRLDFLKHRSLFVEHKSALQRMVMRLTHPAFLGMLALLCFAIALGLFLWAYRPFFDAFVVGCVNNPIACRGLNGNDDDTLGDGDLPDGVGGGSGNGGNDNWWYTSSAQSGADWKEGIDFGPNPTVLFENALNFSQALVVSEGLRRLQRDNTALRARTEVQCQDARQRTTRALESVRLNWTLTLAEMRVSFDRIQSIQRCLNLTTILGESVYVEPVDSVTMDFLTNGTFSSLRTLLQAATSQEGVNRTIAQTLLVLQNSRPGSDNINNNNNIYDVQCPDPLVVAQQVPLDSRAVFDCSGSMVRCDLLACSPPNYGLIRSNVWIASCQMEWYLHGAVLGTALMILTCVLLNLSRVLLVKATVRLLWRNFTQTDRFVFIGSAERNGVLLPPRAVLDNGSSMNEVIRDALKSELKMWMTKAAIRFAFGLLINIPWLYALAYATEALSRASVGTNAKSSNGVISGRETPRQRLMRVCGGSDGG